MRFQGPVEEGRFLSRPNRFLTYVEVDGVTRACFCSNPGRMPEFLEPGRPVLVGPRIGGQQGPTTHVHLAFRHNGAWVGIDTRIPGRLFLEGFAAGKFPFLQGYTEVQPEVTFGASRFDFLLKGEGLPPCFVEVKNCTLVTDGLAQWPDAPSERGAKHLRELALARKQGYRAVVLWIVQRGDARLLTPFEERDPDFAKAVRLAAKRGVEAYAWGSRVTRAGVTLGKEVPVDLGPP
ncbi:MAG TPA: DNA/RNA nuclease SfsA [Candidatus Thermoplasmatota archaeon]|nr:DNA/RNA nuclease SfsA [Candidatus Thermoplasmatota archaeon]